MTEKHDYDLFLSYSSPDRDNVSEIAQHLSEAGLHVWFDQWELVPGQTWSKEIEHALKSAPAVALFFGRNTGKWQQMEIENILSRATESPRTAVIPVLLPGADIESLPASLRHRMAVDLREPGDQQAGLERLVTAAVRTPQKNLLEQEMTLADTLRQAGDSQRSVEHYLRALEIADRETQGTHASAMRADILLRVGSAFQNMGLYSQARKSLEEALALLRAVQEKEPSEHQQSIARTLNNLGGVLRDQGNLDPALSCFQEALSISRSLGEGKTALVGATARTLNNLGTVLRDQGKLDEALGCFREAQALDEGSFGPDHPYVASRLNNIGAVLRDRGGLDEALACFRRALAIDEAAYGPDHPNTANSLNNVASILRDRGQYAEALTYLRRALSIYENSLGPDHSSTANLLNNIGGILRDRGELDEALDCFTRALEIYQRLLGEHHPSVSSVLNNIGNVLSERGEVGRALQHYKQALKIDQQALGEEHASVAMTLSNLGSAYVALGENVKGGAAYRKAYGILENTLGGQHSLTEAVGAHLRETETQDTHSKSVDSDKQ